MSAAEQLLSSQVSAFAETPEGDRPFRKLHSFSTEAERDQLLDEIKTKFSDSRGWMEKLYPRMTRQYKTYRSIADQLRDKLGRVVKNRSNLFIPYPWAMVESEVPRLAGKMPRLHAIPRQDVKKAKVDVIQNNTYWSLDQAEYVYKQILWIRQALIYGWSPMFYFWREERRKCLVRQMNGAEFNIVRAEKTIHDHFDFNVVDVWDGFMQPNVEEPDGGDYFQFRQFMSNRDIEARVASGAFYAETLDDLDKSPAAENQSVGRADRDELANIQRDLSPSAYGRHEVLYHLEDERICVLIDRKVLARCGDNPHPLQEKPIINFNPMPMISEPVGISSIDSLGGLPMKLNALSNLEMDNLVTYLLGVFLAKRHQDVDLNNLELSPRKVILVNDVTTSIKQLDVKDATPAAQRGIIQTKEEMQFAQGISDYTAGVPTSAREANTATGVSTIVREANQRFALKLLTFESRPGRRLMKACHIYNMTYQPVEQMIGIHGPDGYLMAAVNLEDIQCECDFIIEPGSSAPVDQLSRRDSLTQLLDRAMNATGVVDQRKFWLEVLASHEIMTPEDILVKQPEALPLSKDMELIKAENIALMNGDDIDLKGSDSLHLAGHAELEQHPSFRNLPEPQKVAYYAHMEQHAKRFAEERAQAAAATRGQTMFGGANGQPATAAGGLPSVPQPDTSGGLPGASPAGGGLPAQ